MAFLIMSLWIVLSGSILCNVQPPLNTLPRQASENSGGTAELIITLEREPGYWDIGPSYVLTIHADGTVVFQGRKNVKTVGIAKGRISKQDLQRLVKEFEAVNYLSLKDDYGVEQYRPSEDCPEWVTDNDSAYTSLRVGGKTKRVGHYHGCRGTEAVERLTALENRIDEVVNVKQWVG